MEKKKDFKIPFVGLKNKKYTYQYSIDDAFFKIFENNSISNCKVEVEIELEKRENYIILLFYIDGKIDLECDRCLDIYAQEIFGDYKLIIQIGGKATEANDNNDDIIALPANEDFINVAKPIYDYILLSIPYQRIHSNPKDCNQQMIDKLKEKKENNEIDPRWEILNKLKKEK